MADFAAWTAPARKRWQQSRDRYSFSTSTKPFGKKRKWRSKRPAVIEALEPRLLLAADGIPEDAIAVAVDAGLEKFGDMLGRITDPTAAPNTAAIFDVSMPFVVLPQAGTTTAPSNNPVTLRDLLAIDAKNLGQQFNEAVTDGLVPRSDIGFPTNNPDRGVAPYLDDEPFLFFTSTREDVNKPTANDFRDALEAVHRSFNGVTIDLNNVTATVDQTNHRIEYSATLLYSTTQSYFLEPGITAAQLGLTSQSGVQIPVSATLEIGIRFGIDISGTAAGNSLNVFGIDPNGQITNDDFYISVDSMKLGIEIDQPDIPDFTFNFGFLGTTVVDGSIQLDADAEMRSVQSLLGFTDNQLQSTATGSLTAANAPQTPLSVAASQVFDLKFGDLDPVHLTLPGGNFSSANALVSALDAAIDSSSLNNFVHAEVSGDGKVRFVADAFDATALGFGDGSTERSGTTSVTAATDTSGQSVTLVNFINNNFAFSSVEGYSLAADQTFSLLVGENNPIKVVLGAAATSDNNVINTTPVNPPASNPAGYTQSLDVAASRARLEADLDAAIDAALTAAGLSASLVDASIGTNDRVTFTTTTGETITVNERNFRLMPGRELSGSALDNATLESAAFVQSGSGIAVLPLDFVLGSFDDGDLGAGVNRPTVTLTVANVFTSDTLTLPPSDPFSSVTSLRAPVVTYNAAAQQLEPFLNMTAQGFTSILDNLQTSLSAYSDSGIFDTVDLPFTENSLSTIFDLGDFFGDTLLIDDRDDGLYSDDTVSNFDNDIGKLIDTEGKTQIKTAQDFIAVAATQGVTVTPTYNIVGTALSFRIEMSGALDPYTIGVNAAEGLGFVVGFYQSKSGIGGVTQQMVLAPQFAPADGKLTEDVTFVADYAGSTGPVVIKVFAADTADNLTANDLAFDIAMAIQRAQIGLLNFVDPGIVTDAQGNEYIAFVNSSGTAFSIDTRAERALPLAFDLAISPMENVVAQGNWSVDGSMDLDFTLSLDLDKLGTGMSGNVFELSGATKLLDDLGLDTKRLLAVQAPDAPPALTVNGEEVYQLPAGADVSFTLRLTGESGLPEDFVVTIEASETSSNRGVADLLADLKAALREAVDQNGEDVDITTLVEVDISAGRILFTAAGDGVKTLDFTPGSNVDRLGFGPGTVNGSHADLKITTRDGSSFTFALDAATTVQELIDAVETATGNKVAVSISADKFALELVDQTTGTEAFIVESVNGSPLALGLGWVMVNQPEIRMNAQDAPNSSAFTPVTADITVNAKDGGTAVVRVAMTVAFGDDIADVVSKLASAFAQATLLSSTIPGVSGTTVDLGSLGVSAQVENGVLSIKGLGDKVDSLSIADVFGLSALGYSGGQTSVAVSAGESIRGLDLHGDSFVVHATVADMTLGGSYTLGIQPDAPGVAPILEAIAVTALSDFSLAADLTFDVTYVKYLGTATSKTLTLTAAATAGNASLADLVADLNSLFAAEQLDNIIGATTRAGKLVIEGLTSQVTQLSVDFASSADAALLGYAATANAGAVPTPYAVLEGNLGFVGVDMAAHGTLTGSISVDVAGTPLRLPEFMAAAQKDVLESTTSLESVGVDVATIVDTMRIVAAAAPASLNPGALSFVLTVVDTVDLTSVEHTVNVAGTGNGSLADLVADINTGLTATLDANGDALSDRFEAVIVDGKVAIAAKSDEVDVLALRQPGAGQGPAALGFAFSAGTTALSGELADLRITLRDGTSFVVQLDGALTIGDVIQLIRTQQPSADLFEVAIDDDLQRVVFRDLTTPVAGGVFKIENVNGATIGDELGIAGQTATGEILSTRFVDAYEVRSITDAAPALMLTGTVTFDIGYDSRLVVPTMAMGSVPQLAVTFTDGGVLDIAGDFRFTPQTFSATFGDVAQLLALQDLTYEDVILGVSDVVSYVSQHLAQLGALNDKLPVIDQSLRDLFNFVKPFQDAEADFQSTFVSNNIQGVQMALADAMNQPLVNSVITFTLDGGFLKGAIKFNFRNVTPQSIGIDVDAQLLPTLPGSREFGGRAGIPFDAQAELNVNFGFDLATPRDVYLYDTTSFAGTILAQGEELAFLASVGPLAVLARSAEATFRSAANTPANFEIRVNDNRDGTADGRVKVATANQQDLSATISGEFEAFVPTFLKDGVTFVGIVEFDGTLAFKADGSGLDESSWTINMPPVLTGADPTFTSSFSIFDNFSLLVEGLDLFLLNVQDLLDGPRGLGVTLPLGGDELVEAGFFVEPIRAWAVEQLFTLADTLVTSDEAAAFAAINSFLTGTAFNVQVFGETVTVALTPTATDADGDGDFDRLEWDIALSQQDAVVDRVIPLDTLAPALQMEITGFLEVTVDWDFTFTMFLDAIDGFGIELSPAGTPEMHVALDVHLPVDGSGVRITMPDGKIGLFSAIFTDSRNATVITSITAENFLNTAQTLAGNVVFTLGVDKTNDNVVNPINYTVTVSQTDLQEGLSLADTNTSPLEYAINQALKTAKDSSSNTVDLSGDVAAEFVDGRYVLTTNGLTVYNVTISGAGATTLGFADGQQQARLYTYFKPAFTMDLFNAADPTDPELFYGDIDNLTMATTVAATNLSDLPSGVAINRLVGSLVYDFDPAAFTMKLNLTDRAAGAVSEHSLSVQNTSGNTSIADLAQDLRDAITAAGLDGKVTVTVENGKLVLTPDGTLYKHIAVAEKGKALGFSDGQYVHVAPPGAAIAVLALDIDTEGSVAQGFLPGVYSKIDLVYAVTNVPAALITTPDDPGLATGIVSLKFGETLIEVSDLLNGLDQTLEVFEVIFGNPAIETILKMLFEIPGISDLAGAPIGLIDLGFIYATYSAAKDGATSEEIEKIVKRYENAKIFYAFVQSLVQLSRSINVDRSNGFAPFINASEGFDLTFQLSGKDFRLANVPTLYAGNDTSGVFSYSVGSTSSKVDLSKRGELFSGKRQFSDDKVDLAKQFKTPEKPKDGDPPPKLNRSKLKDTTARMMINDFGEGIDTPILTDAENQVIKMLLGVHGNLFAIDLPTVTIENFVEWKMNFFAGPIPLTLTIKLLFNVKLDFAFGWDTGGFYFSDTGLPTGNGADAADILIGQGTGLTPKEISKADIPEISFQFIARVELGIGIPGISISIGAEIGFLINLDFHDANKDGKVQGPELAVGPTDVGLQITVSIYLKFTFLFFEQKINLISLKFDVFEHSNVTPFLAADMTGGTIRLNIGEFSWARFDGDLSDGEERWVISGTSSSIKIEAYLNGTKIGTQSFTNVTKIIGYAGAGNDTIDLSGMTDAAVSSRIYLGIGNDTFIGGAGEDLVYAEDGNDSLTGNGSDDVLMGGAGQDRLAGNAGRDALFGDTGLAVFALPTRLGGDGVSTTADLYRSRVTGRDDSDIIEGGDGDDVIFGGGGRTSQTNASFLTSLLSTLITATDLIDGNDGNDLILGDAGTVTLNAGIPFRVEDTNRGKGSSDLIAGGAGNDDIHGGRGDDYIFGQDGGDTVDGGRGRDFVEAGLGADSARGGNDDDVIYGGKSEDAAAADGNDTLHGDRGNDRIYGQMGDDFIDGGPNDDVLYGQQGVDRILGSRGVDFIFGGADADIISGGSISDIIFGDDGLIAYLNREATGILRVHGEGSLALVPATLLGDRVPGSYEVLATDNKTSDGDDFLSGGEGDDIIFGGSGNDRIGGDLDVADPGTATTAGSTTLPAFVAGVTLDTSGRDTLIGDGAAMNFNLFAPSLLETSRDRAGNDTLYGNRGEDIILGGMGDDLGYGGHGDIANAPDIIPSDTESDRDILAGDNVRILYTVYPFQPSGKMSQIMSSDVDATTAGADSLFGDAHHDVIVGGLGADMLTGGRAGLPADPNDGSDIILGDHARIDANTTVNIAFRDRFPLAFAQSIDPLLGSADTISGSAGDDVLIGGVAADQVSGGLGGDVAFGDEGRVDFVPTKITISGVDLYKGEQIASGRTLDDLASAAGAGVDTIHGDEGDDILFGGSLGDSLFGDADNDIAFGDTGRFELTTGIPGTLRQRATLLESYDPLAVPFILPDLSALPGDDAILGGGGADILFGGFGADDIDGESGADIGLGDNGRIELVGGVVSRLLTTDKVDATTGIDSVTGSGGDDIVAGGLRGDVLRGNDDNDIAVGDNVEIDFFVSGGTSFVQAIETIDPALGGGDDIETDDDTAGDGNDIAIGGFGADQIKTFGLKDAAIGDNARIAFQTALVPVRAFALIETTSFNVGGNDTIDTGAGDDAALGGAKDDAITLGSGDDVGLGDEGQFDYSPVGGTTRLSALITTAVTLGGRDTITGDDGADLMAGGADSDRLEGGIGDDIMLGDNASAALPGGVLSYVTTIADSVGASDTLIDGLGNDIVIGGAAGETIRTDAGNNIVFGDSAAANFVATGGYITAVRVTLIQSVDPFAGADDTIIGNNGNEVLVGGPGNDYLDGDGGSDAIVGDAGRVAFYPSGRYAIIESPFIFTGGNDTLVGGPGNDFMIGGMGSNLFYGDNIEDLLIGASGRIELGPDGLVTRVISAGMFGMDIITRDLFESFGVNFEEQFDDLLQGDDRTSTGLEAEEESESPIPGDGTGPLGRIEQAQSSYHPQVLQFVPLPPSRPDLPPVDQAPADQPPETPLAPGIPSPPPLLGPVDPESMPVGSIPGRGGFIAPHLFDLVVPGRFDTASLGAEANDNVNRPAGGLAKFIEPAAGILLGLAVTGTGREPRRRDVRDVLDEGLIVELDDRTGSLKPLGASIEWKDAV